MFYNRDMGGDVKEKHDMPAKGKIYLVPVPIGNLGDITLRALEVLKSVPLIAAEDTRNAGFLLSRYEIPPPKLISFHKFNERSREDNLFSHLESGQDLAVISDAGTPGISDPAMDLVHKAVSKGIDVVALPGASALLPALTASGLNKGPFLFLGFLPRQGKERDQAIKRIKESFCPVVVYESPLRLPKLLKELYEKMGSRQICIARELTKMYEELIYGDLQELSEEGKVTLKGEFVLVIDSAPPQDGIDLEKAQNTCKMLVTEGLNQRSILKVLQDIYGLKRNDAYQLLLITQNKIGEKP
ncbi:MAG: 16S rRNA (cytidine(1402)-2'-O)-methyltransferase [Candidatus Cloacimonetes bacterium]|nr:16S rRNA (cytidine(1402)-2'-O)-methyltransferase [Candidatus Cloacimonadota bacterium]